MKTSLPPDAFYDMLAHQLGFLHPRVKKHQVASVTAAALERYEWCAKHIALRGYSEQGSPYFNHLHGDQSALVLYFCANSAWRKGEAEMAEMFFLLNKMRNGFVCMYDTELPDVMLLNHTVGTVLGKARYGNFFVAYHGVTVGTDGDNQPLLGSGVVLYPGSSVVGRCTLGDRVAISSGVRLRNAHVPDDTVVAGFPPEVHRRKRDFMGHYFRVQS